MRYENKLFETTRNTKEAAAVCDLLEEMKDIMLRETLWLDDELVLPRP